MDSADTFDIFGLPAEIRNLIYSFAIRDNLAYDLRHRDDDPKNSLQYYPKWVQHVPALCQTSRQFRNETLPIWRANNRFEMVQAVTQDRKNRDSKIHPSLEEILAPHLESGLEHIRRLGWFVQCDRVYVGDQRHVRFHRNLTLNGKHCELVVDFNHDQIPNPGCVITRMPLVKRLLESRVLEMFTTVQRLLGRKLTWEGVLNCTTCKQETEIEH